MINKEYIHFDSFEEEVYFDWLYELVKEGYVEDIESQVEFNVIDKAVIQLKDKKNKDKEYTLLNGISYTADFVVKWADKAKDIFTYTDGSTLNSNWNTTKNQLHYVDSENKSVVDVKGKFAGKNNNSAITFPLVRKILYDKHNIFINKIVPLSDNGLFTNTFTPESYTKTKTGKNRKLRWEYKSMKNYINDTTTNCQSTDSSI